MTVVAEERVLQIFAGNEIKIPLILREEEEDYEAIPDRGCFRVMTAKDGDKRITWNRLVIPEIKAAKDMFMDLLSKGMRAFHVGTDGEQSSREMNVFDPMAEEVIFMPVAAIAGG